MGRASLPLSSARLALLAVLAGGSLAVADLAVANEAAGWRGVMAPAGKSLRREAAGVGAAKGMEAAEAGPKAVAALDGSTAGSLIAALPLSSTLTASTGLDPSVATLVAAADEGFGFVQGSLPLGLLIDGGSLLPLGLGTTASAPAAVSAMRGLPATSLLGLGSRPMLALIDASALVDVELSQDLGARAGLPGAGLGPGLVAIGFRPELWTVSLASGVQQADGPVLMVELTVGGRPLGLVPVSLDPGLGVNLPMGPLEARLSGLYSFEQLSALRAAAGVDGRLTPAEAERAGFALLLDEDAGLITLTAPGEAPPQPVRPEQPTPRMPSVPAAELSLPVVMDGRYLGDVPTRLSTDGAFSLPIERLSELLEPVTVPTARDQLRVAAGEDARVTEAEAAQAGLPIRYDPQTLQIEVSVPATARPSQAILLSDPDRERVGSYIRPARVSAYANLRTSLDYVHEGGDEGLRDPTVTLDGAARLGGVAIEAAGAYQDDAASGSSWTRNYTRLVADDVTRAIRYSFGDLDYGTQRLQTNTEIAGLSIERRYGALNPSRNVRPRSSRSFTLARSSIVELIVNGRSVRRFRLDPGQYDLSNFPLTDGQNDVQIVVEDDTGRIETLDFNLYTDQTLLAAGLSEFSFNVGVPYRFEDGNPDYETDRWIVSGFYRMGLTETWTADVGIQANDTGEVLTAESIVAGPFGVVAGTVAFSDIEGIGQGQAYELSYRYIFRNDDGASPSLGVSLQGRSLDYAGLDALSAGNDERWSATLLYSQPLDLSSNVTVRGSYQSRRFDDDTYSVGVGYNRRLLWDLSFGAELIYEESLGAGEDGLGAFLTLSRRFGPRRFGSTSYGTRAERLRATLSRNPEAGVGHWGYDLDLERDDDTLGLSAAAAYTANRGELGLAHNVTLDADMEEVESQVSSVRLATSVAFADGGWAVGRPIGDAFAIVRGHETLEGREVRIVEAGAADAVRAHTGLAAALVNGLGSYSPQNLAVDVADLPVGYSLGTGGFDLLPPYRAGYLLEVGSAATLTVVGVLTDAQGAPLALLSGRAEPLGDAAGEASDIFTNRQGRFAIAGASAGRWRITLVDGTVYELDIPQPGGGTLYHRAGTLRPVSVRETER